MPEKAKKHEPILLPEGPMQRPVKWPWLWVLLLLFAIISTLWKYSHFDDEALRKQALEQKKEINAPMKK